VRGDTRRSGKAGERKADFLERPQVMLRFHLKDGIMMEQM
jgi:hypothetical protein